MILLIISILVFLITAALVVSAAYFWIEVPASRREFHVRVQSIQDAAMAGAAVPADSQIVREEILSTIPALDNILRKAPLVPRLQLFMTQAAVGIPAGTLLLIAVALMFFCALVAFVAGLPALLIVIVAAGATAIPFLVIAEKRRRRIKQFEEQFPDAIDLLARAVRAGHAFTTGFSLIAAEMPDPVAGEFRTTFEQQNLGAPLAEALLNLSIRMPLPDVRIFLAALNIQRESGGNLGEVLDNLSKVIRERFKLLRQVQVFTAEGRLSMYVLMALPPAAAVLMYVVNPTYMARLFTDPMGHKAIAGAIVLQVLGYLVIRKIVRIKV